MLNLKLMFFYYCLVIFDVFIASLAQLLLKSSTNDQHRSFFTEYLNYKVILGYSIMVISLLLNIYALSKGLQIKEVSIMESLSYLFVPVLSYLTFKEKISLRKIFSIGIIMVGVIIFFQK